MKTHFYLTKVFCLVAAFAIMGCNDSGNNIEQPTEQSIAVTDLPKQGWDNELDSLLYIAATTTKQDTNLAMLYYDIGEIYFNEDPIKAKEYYLKLKTLSENLGWNKGRYLFAAAYTDILNREGLIDSSVIIHEQVLELARAEKNEIQTGKILVNTGNCYNHKQWYETALKYYNEALPIFEKCGEKHLTAQLYSLMGTVYDKLDMQNESLAYCKKAVQLLNDNPDAMIRVYALTNYAVALNINHESEKAEESLLEAQRICNLHNNRYNLMNIYFNMGDIALQKFDTEKTEMYTRQTLELAEEFGDVIGYCIANRSLSYTEMYKGNTNKSEEYIMEALENAIEYELPIEETKCYKQLALLSAIRHDFRSFKLYDTKADSIYNIITSDKVKLSAKEIEIKYETEKKELKITVLEKEKRLYVWLSIAGGVILLLLLAIFIIRQRLAINRRKLAETRIKQMEQERQLVAAQAALDGENAERTRLARDLHDGLGSMLSVVKLNLPEMKSDGALEANDITRFNKAITMLDDSINELRRVAHHIMPASLMRYGLKASLSDFCHSTPSAEFHYFGNDQRLDNKLEILIYRIAHELINNALKHAEATQINVQLVQEDHRLSLTVQDNGKGFDPALKTEGMGLENIRNRIAAHNGILLIDSKPEMGTEVNVELRVEIFNS